MLQVMVIAFISCDDNNSPQYESGNLISWDVVTTNIPVGRALIDKNEELDLACSTGKSIGIKSSYILDRKVTHNVLGNPDGDVSLTYSKTPTTEHLNGWSYGKTAAYWEIGAKYTFNAYYPMDKVHNITSSSTSPFVIKYNCEHNQEDLMMAYSDVNTLLPSFSPKMPVTLAMRHVLSAIEFKFSFNDSGIAYDDSDALTAFWLENSVSDSGLYTIGELEFGKYVNGILDGDSISWTNIANTVAPNTKIYLWEDSEGVEFSSKADGTTTYAYAYSSGRYTENDSFILVIPQHNNGTINFCFKLQSSGNQTYRATLPSCTYLPGKRYHYDIRLGKPNIDVKLTIADWNRLNSSVHIPI